MAADVPALLAMPRSAVEGKIVFLSTRILAAGRKVMVLMKTTSRDLPQTRSANVIGELPGTDLDPEIVLLGAS